MALGFVCYWLVPTVPLALLWWRRLGEWVFSWAGFWASDTGFNDYRRRARR